jgi:chaperonin cofactor prefoldin
MSTVEDEAVKASSSKSKSLHTMVRTKIEGSTDAVFNRVVDRLAEDEIKKREDLLVQGLAKLDEADKEVKKIKPDQGSYDADGKLIGEATFSKAKADELKKAREKLEKISNALEKAFNGDFQKLKELN